MSRPSRRPETRFQSPRTSPMSKPENSRSSRHLPLESWHTRARRRSNRAFCGWTVRASRSARWENPATIPIRGCRQTVEDSCSPRSTLRRTGVSGFAICLGERGRSFARRLRPTSLPSGRPTGTASPSLRSGAARRVSSCEPLAEARNSHF
jgi:hypothetical protein